MAKFTITPEMIAAFEEKGGKVQKVEMGADSGIGYREWKRKVRNEGAPIVEVIPPAPRKLLKLRCGHGAQA